MKSARLGAVRPDMWFNQTALPPAGPRVNPGEASGSVIDSSPMYGAAAGVVGDLLAGMKSHDKAFIATKVWTSGHEAGIRQIRQSMRLLRTGRKLRLQLIAAWDAEVIGEERSVEKVPRRAPLAKPFRAQCRRILSVANDRWLISTI